MRITFGRQRYTINFSCMTQVNDETGNHRPVIMALKCIEKELANLGSTSTPVGETTAATVTTNTASNTEVDAALTTVAATLAPANRLATIDLSDVMDTTSTADLDAKFPGNCFTNFKS